MKGTETIKVRSGAGILRERECQGRLLGVRPHMGRLFLLTDPYHERSGERLALVDDQNQTIYIWYCHKAPGWARRMLAAAQGGA